MGRRRRAWTGTAAALAVLLLATGIAHGTSDLLDSLNDPDRPSVDTRVGFNDYRDTVFTPVRDLAGGYNPYDHDSYLARHPGHQEFDLYLPGWLLLVAPVAALPYEPSEVVWFVLLVGMAIALAWMVLRARSKAAVVGVAGAILWSAPGQLAMFFGQAACAFAAGVVLAVQGARRGTGTSIAAAAGVALSLVKPQTGIPLLVLLVAGLGAYAVARRGVLIAVAVSALPLVAAVVAEGSVGSFISSIVDNARFGAETYRDLPGPRLVRLDVVNTVSKLADVRPGTALEAIAFVAVLAVGVVALRSGRDRGDPALIAAVVACTILAAAAHSRYDGVLLWWPAAALAVTLRDDVRARRIGRLVLLALVAVPLVDGYWFDHILRSMSVPLRVRQAVDSTAIAAALLLAAAQLVRVPTEHEAAARGRLSA